MQTQDYKTLKDRCEEQDQKFSDPYFKNSSDSLCRDKEVFD